MQGRRARERDGIPRPSRGKPRAGTPTIHTFLPQLDRMMGLMGGGGAGTTDAKTETKVRQVLLPTPNLGDEFPKHT